MLIVPITHYPTYSIIPPDLAPAIIEETEQYASSILTLHPDLVNNVQQV